MCTHTHTHTHCWGSLRATASQTTSLSCPQTASLRVGSSRKPVLLLLHFLTRPSVHRLWRQLTKLAVCVRFNHVQEHFVVLGLTDTFRRAGPDRRLTPAAGPCGGRHAADVAQHLPDKGSGNAAAVRSLHAFKSTLKPAGQWRCPACSRAAPTSLVQAPAAVDRQAGATMVVAALQGPLCLTMCVLRPSMRARFITRLGRLSHRASIRAV